MEKSVLHYAATKFSGVELKFSFNSIEPGAPISIRAHAKSASLSHIEKEHPIRVSKYRPILVLTVSLPRRR
jgi:hypothetical protein